MDTQLPELLMSDSPKIRGHFFDQGYNAYLAKDFEDIILTIFLLDESTAALQAYNNGLRQAYKDNNTEGNNNGR